MLISGNARPPPTCAGSIAVGVQRPDSLFVPCDTIGSTACTRILWWFDLASGAQQPITELPRLRIAPKLQGRVLSFFEVPDACIETGAALTACPGRVYRAVLPE